ncbi:hypothetical protein [Phenylobacterium zucineum]|uniref:hypothetical protein n=1 Tax=Phenylobacterium zucineum TaxID=284016 RepID=UPI0002DFA171|nr:hypothetical protein [Phenylobacterium zucineum]
MSSYVIFRGASGAEYSYMPLARAPLLKGRSGNYVLSQPADGGWTIVSAGEAADLGTTPWPQPTGEEVVLIRFNVSRAAREAELADLVPPASADGLPGLRAAS